MSSKVSSTACGLASEPDGTTHEAARSAHPLALWAWRMLRDRSVADKMLVHNACERRMGRGGATTEKQEQAHDAVAVFVEQVGYVPHATEWDAWRLESAERRGLPSAGFIRNAFGGWSALRASFETVVEVDVLSARLTAQGSSFTADERATVLAAWAAATEGPLRWEGLLAWLKSDGPRMAGISRAPREVQTLVRGHESFEAMLEAAGLAHRGVAALGRRPRASSARRWMAPQELHARLLDELREWAGERPGLLFHSDFISHLTLLDVEHPLQGLGAADGLVRRVLGGWQQALASAGLSERVGRGQGNRSYRPDVDEPLAPVTTNDWELLAPWVREAAASGLGAQMSRPQYSAWRRERIEKNAREGRHEAIPCYAKLQDHVGGSWFAVKVRAGVPGAEEYAANGGHYSEADIVQALRNAAEHAASYRPANRRLRPGEYLTWRAAEIARGRTAGRRVRIPGIDRVRFILGGPEHEWSVAVSKAFSDDA